MRRKENEDYQTNLASHLSLLSNPNRIFPQCYLKQKSASILFNFQNMIRSHQIHPLVTLFCLLTEVSFELLIGSSELSNCSQFVSTLTTELLSFFILLPRGLNWFLPPEIKLPIKAGLWLGPWFSPSSLSQVLVKISGLSEYPVSIASLSSLWLSWLVVGEVWAVMALYLMWLLPPSTSPGSAFRCFPGDHHKL